MTYKNTKTGAVIDSPCTISGGDWVAEEVVQKPAAKTTKDLPKKE